MWYLIQIPHVAQSKAQLAAYYKFPVDRLGFPILRNSQIRGITSSIFHPHSYRFQFSFHFKYNENKSIGIARGKQRWQIRIQCCGRIEGIRWCILTSIIIARGNVIGVEDLTQLYKRVRPLWTRPCTTREDWPPSNHETEPRLKTGMMTFLVLNIPSAYNIIFGRPGTKVLQLIVYCTSKRSLKWLKRSARYKAISLTKDVLQK